ncbi:murein L,D-transpeptidase catalytic domain family protein [Pseudomonas sp. NPDC090202]|uniref:murein L,D-transpeptidase catalytic domain family protein n=1 Tax=unclassified Pseudomonas TaxID=196821 RepID=UPI0037FCC156
MPCLLPFALLSGAPALAASQSLPQALAQAAPDANPEVIALAVQAAQCRMAQSEVQAERLAVIDYSRPSTERRLWVFDLPRRTLLFRELVAHGRSSGDNLATSFSNTPDSLASSLGLFSTREAYTGKNGYSLRMDGLEPGINDQAFARDVVIHGAAYVSDDFARANGRLGRSHGCPAVPTAVAQPLIDTLKQGQLLFVYYPDAQWLKTSTFLHCPSAATTRQP